MPTAEPLRTKFAILYCEDEANDLARFVKDHNSEFSVSVCRDIEALPRMLQAAVTIPDLLVLDLYHSRYSPNSSKAKKAAAETKIIEGQLADVLEKVKENAHRHYEARAVSILKELRKQPKLHDVPVLLYTRQGMLGITDEELHEVSEYGAEWMLKGRKPETERRRMHSIIARSRSTHCQGKRVVFLSHAWEDRTIVQPFKDAFFEASRSLLETTQYEWFYTSDPIDQPIQPGDHIWRVIEQRLFRCAYFVAFCSPYYFKSQTCQNELGAFSALSGNASTAFPSQMVPVKISELNDKYYNHIINPGVLYIDLFTPEGVERLCKALRPALKATVPASDTRCKEVATKALEARDKLVQSKDHRIVSLWAKHLADKKYPNAPVTFFIESFQYPDIAVALSKQSKHSLVWALNRSPLLMTAAYDDQKSYLMAHDVRFENLEVQRKYRLVVFADWLEARAYVTSNPDYHFNVTQRRITKNQLLKRRGAFEKSVERCGATLRFTTRKRVATAVAVEHAALLGVDYWDFGFVKTEANEDAEFLFVSGFDSASFVTKGKPLHGGDIRHLTCYAKPHDDRYSVLRTPPYKGLFGPLRGLCDVVDSLLHPDTTTTNVFVDKASIAKLEDSQ